MSSIPIDLPFAQRETPTLDEALRLHSEGDTTGAENVCRCLLERTPHDHAVLFCLGTILHQSSRNAEAIPLLQRSIAISPHNELYYLKLFECFKEEGREDDAAECYRSALKVIPEHADALNDTAVAVIEDDHVDAAIVFLKKAITIDPTHADAHANLGGALAKAGNFEEALEACHTAIGIDDQCIAAYNNMAFTLVRQRKFSEALEFYDHALSIDPSDAKLHFQASIPLLAMGQYKRGWEEYEWRLYDPDFMKLNPRALLPDLWLGESLEGKNVIVWGEQGIGDILQFIRYIPMLRAHTSSITLECSNNVWPLLQNYAGVETVLRREDRRTVPCDVHIPLMSLAKYFGTTVETVPANVPYIMPADESVGKFAHYFKTASFNIGIVWSGGMVYRENKNRSCSFSHFESLIRNNDAAFYSLQKGRAEAQMKDAPTSDRITALGAHFDDFADTAGAIYHLDLVITVDTSVAHLAGAMGKPVWLLLMHAHDWRWHAAQAWYPTVRLFVQPKPGDWASVFAAVSHELHALLDDAGADRL